MAKRNYERLALVPFAQHLLRDGDLDPVYTALNKVGWGEAQKLRWLVAYCAYYHCGVACWMSELEGFEFWEQMHTAARNEAPTELGTRWPRGHERRHFRGAQAIKGIADWRMKYQYPEQMFQYIKYAEPPSVAPFEAVRSRALEHRSVGTWLSFKMVDLVDACLGVPVDQSNLMNFMYEVPLKSLFREWQEQHGWGPGVKPKNAEAERAVIEGMNQWLAKQLVEYSPPHKPGLPLDHFVLETIWCKHQSHLNGSYPLFNDISEICDGLKEWGKVSDSAISLLNALPPGREE